MSHALSVTVLAAASPNRDAATERLQALFASQYDAVWRFIRRLGVPPTAVDDAAQDAFLVVARKLGDIDRGKEKAFLFGTALRVASDARKRARRSTLTERGQLDRLSDAALGPDELIDRDRARALCDRVLEAMPLDLRTVFVLFLTGEMTMAEIAVHLELPPGTVASRIRRARAMFEAEVAELEGRGVR